MSCTARFAAFISAAASLRRRDRFPGRNGHSAGHWEGDTLVVDTTHLFDQVDQRYPHSEQARVAERYHLTKGTRGERVLVIDMTMTDAGSYTRPVTAQKKWVEVPERSPVAVRMRGGRVACPPRAA